MTIGREVFRKHPRRWEVTDWEDAQEFIALGVVEQQELKERMKD